MGVEASEEAGGAASRSRRRGQNRRGGAAVFRGGPLGRGRDQGGAPDTWLYLVREEYAASLGS